MFQLIRAKQTIPFMQYSKPAMWLSVLLIVGSLVTLSINCYWCALFLSFIVCNSEYSIG